MAVETRTIISGGGGNYTTIAGWEAGAPNWGDGDIWKGVISDNAEYNESNVQLISSGTPTSTAHFWLTVDPSNRHSGVAGTGHARMRGNTNGEHVLIVSDEYTRIDWLEIQQDSTGGSDEGIRFTAGTDNCLVSYCVIWADTDTEDQDGIYTGNWDLADLRIDNCIIYGWGRGCINLQQWDSTGRTINADVDHCTLRHTVDSAELEDGAISVRTTVSGDTITVDVYNTVGFMIDDTDEAYSTNDGTTRGVINGGTITLNGSHNLAGDQAVADDWGGTDNTTNWQTASDGIVDTTQSSGSYLVVNETADAGMDLTLLDAAAGNLAAGNATDRQGSEPDSRQDFSVDITGGARPTTGDIDIGAHQVSVDDAFDGGWGFIPI